MGSSLNNEVAAAGAAAARGTGTGAVVGAGTDTCGALVNGSSPNKSLDVAATTGTTGATGASFLGASPNKESLSSSSPKIEDRAALESTGEIATGAAAGTGAGATATAAAFTAGAVAFGFEPNRPPSSSSSPKRDDAAADFRESIAGASENIELVGVGLGAETVDAAGARIAGVGLPGGFIGAPNKELESSSSSNSDEAAVVFFTGAGKEVDTGRGAEDAVVGAVRESSPCGFDEPNNEEESSTSPSREESLFLSGTGGGAMVGVDFLRLL